MLQITILIVLLAAATQANVVRFEQKSWPNLIKEGISSARGVVNSVLGEEPTAEGAWPPAFCNKLDCPKFTVVETTKDYEVRQYETSHWVSTHVANIDYDSATHQLFMKLFQYISGNNVKKEKIAMTSPVLVSIIPGQGPACENNFTMSFFVATTSTEPPQPSDSTVYLSTMPSMKAYVRSFGGFPKEADYIQEGAALAKSLPAGTKYHTEFYYTAGYDAPFKLFNRHNEVWFIGM